EIRLKLRDASRIEALMSRRQFREPVEIGTITRMSDNKRAVERRVRQMLAPKFQRARAEIGDERFRRLGFTPWRQHATSPMAGGISHGDIVTLEQHDVIACTGKQKRLPASHNASANN